MLKLYFYIKKNQNIGRRGKVQLTFEFGIKIKSLSNAEISSWMGRYCWWI